MLAATLFPAPSGACGGGNPRKRPLLRLDDLPVGVLAPDTSVISQVEQVAALHSHLLSLIRGSGEQPPRDAMFAAHPMLILGVMHVRQAAEALP